MNTSEAINELVGGLGELSGLGAKDTKVSKKTEADMATAIVNKMSALPFRCGEDGFYYYYNHRYGLIKDQELKKVISGVMKRLKIGNVYQFGSIAGTFNMLKNEASIKIFEPQRRIISFKNCVLDMSDYTRHDHDPQWMTRIGFGFDYDPNAKCLEWLRFLDYVIPDESSRRVFQEFLGLMFIDSDELSVATALYLYGTGSNGKSVVEGVIRGMLGDDYCSNYELSQLCNSQSSDYLLADVNGKLLNFAVDMGDKEFSGGRYKALAAREPIMARPIGREPIKVKELPLLISNINKIPVITDSSDGFWRRFKIIHFPRKIEAKDQDARLGSKLRLEFSGIFNWIIEGRKRLMDNDGHFTRSEYMERMATEIRMESNSVLSYTMDSGYVANKVDGSVYSEVKVLSRTFMEQYKEYCLMNNYKPKSSRSVVSDLTLSGFEYRKVLRVDGDVSSGFIFYKLESSAAIDNSLDDISDSLPF